MAANGSGGNTSSSRQAKNGNSLVERHFEEHELQRMRGRVCDIHDKIDKMKDERRSLLEEEKDLRAKIKKGFELVEGEQLPFHKGEQRA
jgi:hypothetical protein